ncbi:MAG TPA: hypothetical protein VHE78_08400 [Gemmatimonadaceae bacterium]|nr:hypothetical protein [Gemmatimonadaceae bacterium]
MKTAWARALAWAGAVLCGLVAPGAARAQLEVDHFEVFLTAGPGQARGAFTVRNVSDQPQTSQLRIGDWERTLDGGQIFHDSAGVLSGSCQPAVEVFPTILRLAPGESQAVLVTYSGGARSTSCWSIIYVATAPKPAALTSGAQVIVELRQGIKLYVEPPATRPELTVDTVDVEHHVPGGAESAADTAGTDVMAIVRNRGVIQSLVKGSVEYRTLGDSLVQRVTMDEFPVLPGSRRRVRSRVPQLPPGRYVVLMLFDFRGAEIVAGQINLDLAR